MKNKPMNTNTPKETTWQQAAQRMLSLLKRDMHNHQILGDPWQNAVVNMLHVQTNIMTKIQRPRVNRKHPPPETWEKARTQMVGRLNSRMRTRMLAGTWLGWASNRAATPHLWTNRNADVRLA